MKIDRDKVVDCLMLFPAQGSIGIEDIHRIADIICESNLELIEKDDQDIKADKGKLALTLVPSQIIKDIAEVRMYGSKKYGSKECWHRVSIDRYQNAMFRHLLAYLDNPDGVDEESGISHLKHLACNIAFLCELEKKKTRRKIDERNNNGGATKMV